MARNKRGFRGTGGRAASVPSCARRGVPKELREQLALAGHLDGAGLVWCHVPNGGARHPAVAGKLKAAGDFLAALELLASLRLCSNVPGQWAVQTALGGYQSIRELTQPGGRLFESRRAIIESVADNPSLQVSTPKGALYAFVGVNESLPQFDDQAFALDLLERKHVLVAPGVSFNVPYRNHFRITNLPDAQTLRTVFSRMGELLTEYRNKAL